MPSATLTIHPHKFSSASPSSTSWIPTSISMPSKETAAKGAAVLAAAGLCYVAYQSFQNWCDNWSPLDYFKEKDEDKK